MPVLVQISIVIVTIGLVAIGLLTVRMMTRFFDRAAKDISQLTVAVREAVVEFDLATRETRALVAALKECVPPVQRVVNRFESVGQRAADLSSTVLEEIEGPVFTATAVARGVRSGTDQLLKRLMNRFTHHHTSVNGGQHHE